MFSFLLLCVVVLIFLGARNTEFIERNDDIIGWCINGFMSFVVPICITICFAITNDGLGWTPVLYLIAGILLYVGLRLQAAVNPRNAFWTLILPYFVFMAAVVVSQGRNSWFLFWAIVTAVIIYILNNQRSNGGRWSSEKLELVSPSIVTAVQAIEAHEVQVAYAFVIKDYLFLLANQQLDGELSNKFVNQYLNLAKKRDKPDNDPQLESYVEQARRRCCDDPVNAIREMLTFPISLKNAYKNCKDPYYNLDTIQEQILGETGMESY